MGKQTQRPTTLWHTQVEAISARCAQNCVATAAALNDLRSDAEASTAAAHQEVSQLEADVSPRVSCFCCFFVLKIWLRMFLSFLMLIFTVNDSSVVSVLFRGLSSIWYFSYISMLSCMFKDLITVHCFLCCFFDVCKDVVVFVSCFLHIVVFSLCS